MVCLILSELSTVGMPRRVPKREARVDLPVPEVPASSTITFTLDCISRLATRKSLRQSGFSNSLMTKHRSRMRWKRKSGIVIYLALLQIFCSVLKTISEIYCAFAGLLPFIT